MFTLTFVTVLYLLSCSAYKPVWFFNSYRKNWFCSAQLQFLCLGFRLTWELLVSISPKFGTFQAANYRLIGWKLVRDLLSLPSIVGRFHRRTIDYKWTIGSFRNCVMSCHTSNFSTSSYSINQGPAGKGQKHLFLFGKTYKEREQMFPTTLWW